jgi:GxxExxY protein
MHLDGRNAGDDRGEYLHQELTARIIRVFYDVYNELGHGFTEPVYHKAMELALRQAALAVEARAKLPVYFRGIEIGVYEADVVVENLVILELKAVKVLEPAHEAQLLHYLKSTRIELGLLLNFGPNPQVRRRIFDNERKQHRGPPDE